MTIRPGEEWGRAVVRPDCLVAVTSDAEVIPVLDAGGSVLLVGGDLARTLGRTGTERPDGRVLELPIDLIDVSLDGVGRVACAHVVVRRRLRRGGWWFGTVIAVMNAEFVGEWDVAPRGHPNDGRVEVVEAAAALGMRDRLAARRRLRLGTHVPHPSISIRSVREAAFDVDPGSVVVVDGRAVGERSVGAVRSLRVRVRPDAAVVHI